MDTGTERASCSACARLLRAEASPGPPRTSLPALADCLLARVVWQPGPDLDHPWGARVEGRAWLLFLGDFPDEHLYTLLVDAVAVGSFDDWPPSWSRASAVPLGAAMRRATSPAAAGAAPPGATAAPTAV